LTDLNDEAQEVSEILAAHYEKVSINNVIDKCKHLNDDQCTDLTELLSSYTTLFSGKLGHYPHETVHIEIDKGATPVHKRHYPVPRIHEQTFKDELERLIEIGVLEPCGRSEWAAPTFIIPKKDNTARFVSDF
jgi:hypothetical protein